MGCFDSVTDRIAEVNASSPLNALTLGAPPPMVMPEKSKSASLSSSTYFLRSPLRKTTVFSFTPRFLDEGLRAGHVAPRVEVLDLDLRAGGLVAREQLLDLGQQRAMSPAS